MHLLSARPGGYSDEEGITVIDQSPGDIVVLSAQDTDLLLLSTAAAALPPDYPELRLTSLLQLRAHASVDRYLDEVIGRARLVLISLLGGAGYWRYGLEQVVELARARDMHLVLVPGDDHPDNELVRLSTVDAVDLHRVWRYLREGGADNGAALLAFIRQRWFSPDATPEQTPCTVPDPRPLPRVVIYQPGSGELTLDQWRAGAADGTAVLLLFYRAHFQSGNTPAFDELAQTLERHGLNPLLLAVTSLKDSNCLALVNHLAAEAGVQLILNCTGFAIRGAGSGSGSGDGDPFARPFAADVPVLQLILAGSDSEDWRSNSLGLRPPDLAMNVVLPEMDGRIITRAVSFKESLGRDPRTQCERVGYQLQPDRAEFVAELAANWVRLAATPNSERRVALILANYPTKEGRIGNGVGLDTPASTIAILKALAAAGYPVADLPKDGDALLDRLLDGVGNDLNTLAGRPCFQSLALGDYQRHFDTLPAAARSAVRERWGEPEGDPRVRQGRIMVAGVRLGACFVGIQPARGYNLDLSATYHDPDLVPTHAYLAFHFWLRHHFAAHAVVHVGKHGNLEWLPGKGVALSAECWPELALGPVPHFYPFIVNDPGEGSQAKRRAQAVIIDHLMPPLTRAETYGPLRQLEGLMDELYEARQLDPARGDHLQAQVLELVREQALHRDLGLAALPQNSDADAVLTDIDAYLCELKEAQIRGGLHILGQSPRGELRRDTLLALVRLPRGSGPGDQGLLHVLARDLGLPPDYDPLGADPAKPWHGPRPAQLAAPGADSGTDSGTDSGASIDPWRSHGDTRERLELLAQALLDAGFDADADADTGTTPPGPASAAVLDGLRQQIAPRLDRSGPDELENLLHGLNGGFVPPGPSGAPSRGRPDVLPTGRNFYSLDTRSIPTPAAWDLGWRSAANLVERYVQEHGDYPHQIGLSVWGTSTMRTGGDDIAQAMALLGVRPVWEAGSGRVTDFELLPQSLLGRPRVDVTLRISGFFRDAFINVVRLFDAAVQAVAALDEPAADNALAASVRQRREQLEADGIDPQEAARQAGWRVFGSKPGAYGAGLQGLIDERCWEDRGDLARAYLEWGGYAYGKQTTGAPAQQDFAQRLGDIELVVQNQDNREHDLLDSDDYYQFQGGMTAAVRELAGRTPAVFHGDHSNPASPRMRTLNEEISRVIRSRVVNPKWLAAMRRHGYKGAFEMAATVDYLFAYDATTGVVRDDQYQQVTEQLLLDPDNRDFLQRHNPNALYEMSERLIEAMQRGLWERPGDYRDQLEQLLLDGEESLEGKG